MTQTMHNVYPYDASGYYLGYSVEDYGILPNNATYVAPEIQEGCIAHWNGKAWEQVENHIGKQGYVSGEPFTVKDYGALPENWSDTPPEKPEEEQQEEQYNNEKRAIDAKYSAPWDGSTSGILIDIQMRMTLAVCETPRDEAKIASLDQAYKAALINMQTEFDALDVKYGIA